MRHGSVFRASVSLRSTITIFQQQLIGGMIMSLTIRQIHPHFVGEVSHVDLRAADDQALQAIRDGMDKYGVLVFHGQPMTNEEQLAFSERLDGVLHTKTSLSVLEKNRFGTHALTDISNVND